MIRDLVQRGPNFLQSTAAIGLLFVLMPPAGAQGPPEQPDMEIDAAVKAEVVETMVAKLDQQYVFPEIAAEMGKALRAHAAAGDYEGITSAKEFAETLTEHLQAVSHDKHLRVRYSHEPLPVREDEAPPTPEEIANAITQMAKRNFGFEKVERLQGNVGYLDLRGFFPTEYGAETAIAAMNFLANTDALIVDLRQNGGGSPAMVALISSYFFNSEEPVHLNSLYWREGDQTHQWWTLPHVPGKRSPERPVYVLTAQRTFSAAEEFTYNLKNLKRATIVGETTGGGAHPGGGVRLHDHFGMFVPSGRAINPISGTNWEGTGVTPDVESPADDAFDKAYVLALQGIAEKETHEGYKKQLEQLIADVQAGKLER